MIPVYLYIKTHNVTGMKYFGRTVFDPFTYKGSGLRWLRHIAEHGNDVTTEIYGVFEDEETLVLEATKFSQENRIVESDEWANLVVENGLTGLPRGSKLRIDPEVEKRRGEKLAGYWSNEEWRANRIQKCREAWDNDRRERHSKAISAKWDSKRRKTLSETIKQYWVDGRYENVLDLLRRPKSEEHKRNISRSLKGKPKSPQHIENIKKSTEGRRPARAPKDVEFNRDGSYSYKGFNIIKLEKTKWKVIEMGTTHKRLKEAVASINNAYLLKSKD